MATLNIKEYLDRDEQKDLLRFLTAGSVDDGKSTLIGRLLFDSKKLYEDQLDALERDSKRMGNAGDHIDYALLLDGLKAEREQGITIDVAYRYFSTNNRKFISIKRIKRTIKKCESGKITKEQLQKSIQSWTGHAGHADSYNLRKKIETLAEAAIEKAA